MKYIRLVLTAAAAMAAIGFAYQSTDIAQPVASTAMHSKINGVSFVAPGRPIDINALKPIQKVNASWIAITPYAFSQAGQPRVIFNHGRQMWGEREKGVAQTIQYAKKLGLKVMLKPHVWVHGPGESWTGDFSLQTDRQWQQWQANYTNYIVSFAKIADSLDVDLICIGTEYSKAANTHPQIWRQLIQKVRAVYSGKLTYAANWDNYQNIAFWDDLDYIGIDAYFPLTDKRNVGVAYLKKQWEPLKKKLHTYSSHQKKPILFTEFGYQSVDFTAAGHWKYKRNERAENDQAQVQAYRALFETFWHEPWFAGGFLWKWFPQPSRYHRSRKKGYTPQGKPAEQTLRDWYAKNGVLH